MTTPPKPATDTIHEPLDVYNDPENATVDIVAVPGLGANPVKSWQWDSPTSSFNWITDKKRTDNKENVSAGNSQLGLANDCPTARVLLYNYVSAYQDKFYSLSMEIWETSTIALELLHREYDSDVRVGPWKIKQYIVNIATKLLFQLQSKREQNIRRPLVFIGHSMGGLVIAKALVLAEQQRDKFPDMYECISGCLFFGTPFDGAPVADIAKEWAVINEKLGLAINSKLIDLLTPGNEALRELKHDFVRSVNKLAVKVEIHCFWEQKETHWEALVAKLASQDFSPSSLGKLSLQEYREFVSRDSATLPGVGDTGIARTHRDLVRFESAKDPEYQVVKVPLKRIVNAAVLTTKGRFNSTRQSAIDRTTYNKILKALDGAEVHKKYKALQQRASSDSWIVGDKEPEYVNWLDGENRHDDYLWIHGQEGRGKSGAAVSIIQAIEKCINKIEESTDKAPHLLAYFFCDETPDYCTAEDVVKSLIRQLCLREEILATYAGQFIEKKLDNTKLKATSLSIENLWQSLQEMLSEGTIGTIYVIINNLHVLQDSPSTHKLYSFINEGIARVTLGKSNRVRTKWLITSRSHKAMGEILGSTEVRKIDLDDPKHRDQKRAELQKYAWTKAEDLRKEKNYTRATTYFAGSIIGNRAGNTKWIDVAAVQLAALPADSSEIKVRRALEHVPHDYDALLNVAWSSILKRNDEDMDTIRELLRALVLTYQDPKEKELLVLAGHSPDDAQYQTKLRMMIEKCRPLVTVRKSGDDIEIGFVNADAKNHLLTHSEDLLNVGEEWIEWQHGILALRCFSYVVDVLGKVPPEAQPTDDQPETTEKPAGGPELSVSKPKAQADLGAELGTVVAEAEVEVVQEESPSADNHSDSDANETEDKLNTPSLTLAYPTKYWLRHASDENRDIAKILTLEREFWEPKSRLRLLWLQEYNKLTNELEGFLPDTWTALHVAAFVGFTKLVVALIEAGTGYQDEIYEYDSLINTPLHLASYYGKAETVECLLKAGSKVDDMGPDGTAASPLAMAAYEGRIMVMKRLIGWGANVNAIDHTSGPILNSAIISGSAEAVKLLLENEVRLNYEWEEVKVAPLAMSAYYSDLPMFNTILEEAKDSLSPGEYDKGLIWAAAAGNLEVLKRLFDFDHEKQAYQSALKCATVESNWESVLLILNHPAAQALDCNELIRDAATNSDDLSRIVKAAWNNSAGTVSKEVMNDCLYEATDMEKESTVRLLLELGADPNAKGEEYGNALTAAAYDGTDQIVEALLAAGAEVNSSSGYAIQAAAAQGHEKVVRILLDHGANIDEISERHEACTALQAACNSSHLDVVKLLLDRGANPNLGGGPYTRPIFGAIYQGGPDILDRLLEAEGLEFDIVGAPDQLNSTPLYAAAFVLPAEKMNALINRGATIDFADQDGDTALIAAAWIGDAACVKLLLERGADFLHISQAKGTALEVAAKNGHKECVDLLLARAKVLLRGLQTASERGDQQARELIMREKSDRREAMIAEAEAEAKAQAEAAAATAAAAAAEEDTEQGEPELAASGQETLEPEVVENGDSNEKAAHEDKNDDTVQQPVQDNNELDSGLEKTEPTEYPTPESMAASDSDDTEVQVQASEPAEDKKLNEKKEPEIDSEAD